MSFSAHDGYMRRFHKLRRSYFTTVFLDERGPSLVEHASQNGKAAKADPHATRRPVGKVSRYNRRAHTLDLYFLLASQLPTVSGK